VTGRRDPETGYALLAALLIGVLAATFSLAVVSAVHVTHVVGASDASAWRAALVRDCAVDAACAAARWRPAEATGTLEGGDEDEREAWSATWEPAPPGGSSPWTRRRVRVTAAHGASRRRDELTVECRAEEWATGVSVTGDAEFTAPFVVAGSGVYAGGCVRGREQVAFDAGSTGTTVSGLPADRCRGTDTAAAVHAVAGIFREEVEVHDPSCTVSYPDDRDRHTGGTVPAEWVAGPSPEVLAAASEQAEAPGAALADGVLRLDEVAPATTAGLLAGRCLLVPRGEEVCVEGAAPAEAGPLLIVVQGDAVVGQPGGSVSLRGALVVCGRLTIRGDFHLTGSLHAGSLVTRSPVSIVVETDWRERLLPGAVRPVVTEHGAS
jgi:hypothetical protein